MPCTCLSPMARPCRRHIVSLASMLRGGANSCLRTSDGVPSRWMVRATRAALLPPPRDGAVAEDRGREEDVRRLVAARPRYGAVECELVLWCYWDVA